MAALHQSAVEPRSRRELGATLDPGARQPRREPGRRDLAERGGQWLRAGGAVEHACAGSARTGVQRIRQLPCQNRLGGRPARAAADRRPRAAVVAGRASRRPAGRAGGRRRTADRVRRAGRPGRIELGSARPAQDRGAAGRQLPRPGAGFGGAPRGAQVRVVQPDDSVRGARPQEPRGPALAPAEERRAASPQSALPGGHVRDAAARRGAHEEAPDPALDGQPRRGALAPDPPRQGGRARGGGEEGGARGHRRPRSRRGAGGDRLRAAARARPRPPGAERHRRHPALGRGARERRGRRHERGHRCGRFGMRHERSVRARAAVPAFPDHERRRHGRRRVRSRAVHEGHGRAHRGRQPAGRGHAIQAELSAGTGWSDGGMSEKTPLLIVEDDPALLTQMTWALEQYAPVLCSERQEALVQMRRHRPAVVTMDLGLPPHPGEPTEGFRLLQEILALAPDTKVIVLTGQNDHANALKAIGLGAYDFYSKPFQPELLALMIERALRLHELQAENRKLHATRGPGALGELLTRDPQMLKVCGTVEKVAATNATVMLLGESGTGKEVLARAAHTPSPRREGRFVAINCAAIPENLLESELFGYEKGAFTGAVKQTPGKIELAHRGTLFLDEIGDLPAPLQAKILRFLQDRIIERLGGRQEIAVDVRVVCATHQDLRAMIAQGRFREDLYYRLAEIVVEIPPLRSRKGDAALLAQELAREAR